MINITKIYTKTPHVDIIITTNYDEEATKSVIYEKWNNPDFFKLSNTEKEKIIEKLVRENIGLTKVTIKIKDEYFLINKFFQLISKLN